MSRELNSPREILRRFLFVACLAGGLAAAIFLLLALVSQQPWKIFQAVLAVAASVLLYFFGRHNFDFSRLAASFPAGEEESDLPGEVREELETLLRDIDNPATNWMTRHDLRKRLAVIIRQEPRLLELYGREISSAFPYPAGKPLKNDQ